jgi:hypothetical protein
MQHHKGLAIAQPDAGLGLASPACLYHCLTYLLYLSAVLICFTNLDITRAGTTTTTCTTCCAGRTLLSAM